MSDSDDAEPKQELAEERTDFAEDRTVLANERTFASWFRTGFAAVGIGLGFQALFLRMEPAWVPRSIATVFLVIGIILFISAERRACKVQERLSAHQVQPERNRHLRLFAISASLAVAALIAAMWLLAIEPAS